MTSHHDPLVERTARPGHHPRRPVWSQDKDLGVAGVEVFSTGELLDALRNAEREQY